MNKPDQYRPNRYTIILVKTTPDFRSFICHTTATTESDAVINALDELADHHQSRNISDYKQCFVIRGNRWVKLVSIKE